MRRRLQVIAIIFGICEFVSVSMLRAEESRTWNPRVNFQLDDGDYSQTLAWISGWSYALTEVGRANVKQKFRTGVCVSKDGSVDSKVLLDALNNKFNGQRITSEQAAAVLYDAAKAKYGCK